jgi:hypothetical protein
VAKWSRFDNTTGTTARLGESTTVTPSLKAPDGLPRTEGAFVKVEVSAVGTDNDAWAQPATAYFRLGQGRWTLVGFERVMAD